MSPAPKRYRGVVLTERGLKRLESAIATAQEQQKYGKRFTQAELEELTGISIKTIKKIRQGDQGVDQSKIAELFTVFGLALETADYGLPELTPQESEPQPTLEEERSAAKIDWGEKPDTAIFFGRTEDLATLSQWVMAEQCRVVTLLGMGGIGKTSLAAKLADQIYGQFDYVIWRSLREAPPLDEILVRLIQFLSDQQETEINLPGRLGERIIRLLHYLRQHRCLLVLDNLESILQAESAGRFRDGYEGYGELIHRIGEAEHQSCLLLTSRECPRELAPMASDRLPVRLWSVTGIDAEAGREILKAKGLELDETNPQGQELIHRYSGNPQALHLVATAIQREFLGDVDDFLEEEGAAVEDVRSLLDQHLTRLAPLERSILFWLAINREPVGLDELMEDLLPPVTKREVRSALRGLSDRYLIETVGKQFTLQNVIMEFATERFVEQVSRELNTQQFELFCTHALIKSTVKDYVRETQIRLIIDPVRKYFGEKLILEEKAIDSILKLRKENLKSQGYGPANVLNLLSQISFRLSNLDFSDLSVKYAFLQGINLQNTNFKNTHFEKCVFTKTEHSIFSLAFDEHNHFIAVGTAMGKIHIMNFSSHELVAILDGHKSRVRDLFFISESHALLSRGEDNQVFLWDFIEGECIKNVKLENQFRILMVNLKQQCFVIADENNFVEKWCIKTFKHLETIYREEESAIAFAISPDLRTLAVSTHDSEIKLWSTSTKKYTKVLSGHKDFVISLDFNASGDLLISGSRDLSARLWDVSSGRCLQKFSNHQISVRPVIFSHDGKIIATSDNNFVNLWCAGTGKLIHKLYGHLRWISQISFSFDDKILATSSSQDDITKFWDVRTGQCFRTWKAYDNHADQIAFDCSGKRFASNGSASTVRLWDSQTGNLLKSLESELVSINSYSFRSLFCFGSDDQIFTCSKNDKKIYLWDSKDGELIKTYSGHSSSLDNITISPELSLIASSDSEYITKIWDIFSGNCVRTLVGHTSEIRKLLFFKETKRILSADRSSIKIWDLETGSCVEAIATEGNLVHLYLSPSEKFLACSNGASTDVFRTENGQHIFRFGNGRGTSSKAIFDKAEKNMITTGWDGHIRVWNIESGHCCKDLKGHESAINDLALSPDKKTFATSSDDGHIKLWDMQTTECVRVFSGHSYWALSLCFSKDSKALASSSKDETIKIWDVITGKCLKTLIAPRPYEEMNITRAQGLTNTQRTTLMALGAIDENPKN
jgi:WD40 repeat protein/transcriptional regulator with XRE-family HTH domain